MKANKFPGNMMKQCGIKSWCQLGIVAAGALILFLMALRGWSFDWNGALPGANAWEWVWNFLCTLVAFFSVAIGVILGLAVTGFGLYHGGINVWKWACDSCEQINYEDDDDV